MSRRKPLWKTRRYTSPQALFKKRISVTTATRDQTPTRTVAESGIVSRSRTTEKPVAKSLNQRSTVTRLPRIEATPVMTATISPNGRKAEAVTAKWRTGDGCPEEIWIPTQNGSSGEPSAALSKCPDKLSGRGDSDSDDDECHQKRRRSTLQIAHPLNDLFVPTADYRKCKLSNKKGDYQDLSSHVLCFRKKTDNQMRPHAFSCGDPIAALSFFAKFKDICSPNRVPDSNAVWCFYFYVKARRNRSRLPDLREARWL